MRIMIAVFALSICTWSLAQDSETPPAAHGAMSAEAATTHAPVGPVIPNQTRWAGSMVIVILGLFVMAAAVGVAVRVNAPDEVPPADSHDEPPGASHHHGSGGLTTPDPGHDDAHGHGHATH